MSSRVKRREGGALKNSATLSQDRRLRNVGAHSVGEGARTPQVFCSSVMPYSAPQQLRDPSKDTGQWCLTGAQLPWAQRRLLALVLGEEEVQEAFACSLDEAALLLERAEAAKPRFYSRNLLTLGRVHLQRGREDLAGYYLQEAAQYPAQSDDDHAVRREASALLSRLQRAQAATTALPVCRAKSEDPKDTPPSEEPAAQPRGDCPSSNHEEDEPCVGSPKEDDE